MAQQMSLYFQPSRHFCNSEASYPVNNTHLRYGNSSPLALLPGLYCHMYWAGAGEWCPCTPSSGPCQASPENQEGFQKLCFTKGVGGRRHLICKFPLARKAESNRQRFSVELPFLPDFSKNGRFTRETECRLQRMR